MRRPTVLAAVLLSGGCGAPTSPRDPMTPEWPALPAGARTVPFERIERVDGATSGFQEAARVVVENQQQWAGFWEIHQAGRFPTTDPPVVDFELNRVVAAIMGPRNTGGYAISIAGVFESADRTIVRVLEASPGSDCSVIQVITSPVTAAKIPRSTRSVEFANASVTRPCN